MILTKRLLCRVIRNDLEPIWNFFHYDESKPNWALCKACSTGFTQYQNGNLLEHLNQRHREQLEHLPVVERFARPNKQELQSIIYFKLKFSKYLKCF